MDEVSIDRWRFSHALVRSTLYDELGTSRRVRPHRTVAQIIEELRPEDLSALARHFGEAAVAGTTEQAVRYALAAGDRSHAQLANDEAVTFYASALDLLEDGDQRRAAVLARLGDAQFRAGDPAYRGRCSVRLSWRTRPVTPTPRSLQCSRRAGASSARWPRRRGAHQGGARWRSTRLANVTPSSARACSQRSPLSCSSATRWMSGSG